VDAVAVGVGVMVDRHARGLQRLQVAVDGADGDPARLGEPGGGEPPPTLHERDELEEPIDPAVDLAHAEAPGQVTNQGPVYGAGE